MTPGLYWSEGRPDQGWRIVRSDDATGWNAEQIDGPGLLSAANLPGLLSKLAGEDTALQRRYTERQIRRAVPEDTDPGPIVANLRAQEGP